MEGQGSSSERKVVPSSRDNEDITVHGQSSEEQSISSSHNLLPDEAIRMQWPVLGENEDADDENSEAQSISSSDQANRIAWPSSGDNEETTVHDQSSEEQSSEEQDITEISEKESIPSSQNISLDQANRITWPSLLVGENRDEDADDENSEAQSISSSQNLSSDQANRIAWPSSVDIEDMAEHGQISEEESIPSSQNLSSDQMRENADTTEQGHSSEPESILSSKNLPLDQVNRRTLQSSGDNEDTTIHGQISDEQSIPSSQNLLQDQANRITLPSPEITTITVHFDRSDERYYVGEDVSIEANLVNPSAVQCLAWIRKTENGNLSTCIDTTLPKYTQTGNETDKCFGLKINNCDESDAGTYLLLAVCTTVNISSNEISLQVVKGPPEVTLIQTQPAIACVKFEAKIRCFPKHQGVLWKKGNEYININAPKYEGSTESGDNPVLCLNDVKEKDIDLYTIEVNTSSGIKKSGQILEVLKGLPEVTLNKVPLALTGTCVKFKATIKNIPQHQKVIWMKGTHRLNINESKYEESTENGENPVLCIKNIIEEDSDTYTIEVENRLGTERSSQRLEVIKEDQFIFISGPVMVSPLDDIDFLVHLPKKSHGIPMWMKIKDQSNKKIEFDSNKYSYRHENRIHRMKITKATEEDSAEYQFLLGKQQSNKIYVYIDDTDKKQANCLRLFALLDVSAEALRITFDREPKSFEQKINKIMENCRKDKKNIKSGELLSRLQMLQTNQTNSLKDVDITQLYTMLRHLVEVPTNYPWGRDDVPKENDTEIPDDIERIRHYRNRVCHSDASEMDTSIFNESVLDLLGAIRRLSSSNCKLIKESCVILNQVFTEVEYIAMKEKLKTFKKEQEKESKLLLNEDTGKLERTFRRTDVRFHDVCDSSISITKNYSTATQSELVTGGVCFMNRPMKFGEEVHIRGKYASLNLKGFKEHISLKIGLTEIDPDQIRSSINKKEASRSTFYSVNCVPEEDEGPSESFHLRLSLRDRNASRCRLETRLNEDQPEYFPDLKVPINGSLWLAIDLYRIKSIMISDN